MKEYEIENMEWGGGHWYCPISYYRWKQVEPFIPAILANVKGIRHKVGSRWFWDRHYPIHATDYLIETELFGLGIRKIQDKMPYRKMVVLAGDERAAIEYLKQHYSTPVVQC